MRTVEEDWPFWKGRFCCIQKYLTGHFDLGVSLLRIFRPGGRSVEGCSLMWTLSASLLFGFVWKSLGLRRWSLADRIQYRIKRHSRSTSRPLYRTEHRCRSSHRTSCLQRACRWTCQNSLALGQGSVHRGRFCDCVNSSWLVWFIAFLIGGHTDMTTMEHHLDPKPNSSDSFLNCYQRSWGSANPYWPKEDSNVRPWQSSASSPCWWSSSSFATRWLTLGLCREPQLYANERS